MPRDPDQYDFFVSYARQDNRPAAPGTPGWISSFVEELLAEHRKFTGGRSHKPDAPARGDRPALAGASDLCGRSLTYFFDKDEIRGLDDWQHRIYHALAGSRLFLAFISPSYFASEWCRREWRAWIDTEIAKHILSAGVAPIYIVEVPGLVAAAGAPRLSEQEVARQVAELCGVPPPHAAFLDAAAPVVKQLRRRQINAVQPFYRAGVEWLRREDSRRVLQELARDLHERAERVRHAAESEHSVTP